MSFTDVGRLPRVDSGAERYRAARRSEVLAAALRWIGTYAWHVSDWAASDEHEVNDSAAIRLVPDPCGQAPAGHDHFIWQLDSGRRGGPRLGTRTRASD